MGAELEIKEQCLDSEISYPEKLTSKASRGLPLKHLEVKEPSNPSSPRKGLLT